jgi:hypothetical protein
MADDALSRAKKTLAAPKSGAVVPAARSGRDLIALAKAAASRPSPSLVRADPRVRGNEVSETKPQVSTALVVERVREAAARPLPVRPKPEPPNEPAKADTPAPVPVAAPAQLPVPVTQVVPVEIAPGQTVPVEIPPNAGNGGQPIVVNVNVVNEQRGPYWGPYWPYPYWHGCSAWNCPRRRGLPCTGWFCR